MSSLDNHLCDVTFIVENTEFEAQRLVLSNHSTVFEKQLFGNFLEAQKPSEPIIVDDVSAKAFEVCIAVV